MTILSSSIAAKAYAFPVRKSGTAADSDLGPGQAPSRLRSRPVRASTRAFRVSSTRGIPVSTGPMCGLSVGAGATVVGTGVVAAGAPPPEALEPPVPPDGDPDDPEEPDDPDDPPVPGDDPPPAAAVPPPGRG